MRKMLSCVLLLLTKRLIIALVNLVLAPQRRIASAALSSYIADAPSNELGELVRGANEMTRSQKAAQEQISNWAHTLAAKVDKRPAQIKHRQTNRARLERLAALGEMVTGIAHEINNPLTGILLISSTAGETPGIDEQLKEDLANITRETQRCAGIVKGVLDFGRESIPHKSLIDLHDILDKTLALVEKQILFQNINIVRNYAGTLPAVTGDPHQLEQVFMNMFINAAQAMPSGGELTIVTTADEQWILVRVADCGCGIPRENLGRIFDPFFSTKEQNGTGLGLSVSSRIVADHGGDILVESSPETGTAFTIRLPTPIEPQLGTDSRRETQA